MVLGCVVDACCVGPSRGVAPPCASGALVRVRVWVCVFVSAY